MLLLDLYQTQRLQLPRPVHEITVFVTPLQKFSSWKIQPSQQLLKKHLTNPYLKSSHPTQLRRSRCKAFIYLYFTSNTLGVYRPQQSSSRSASNQTSTDSIHTALCNHLLLFYLVNLHQYNASVSNKSSAKLSIHPTSVIPPFQSFKLFVPSFHNAYQLEHPSCQGSSISRYRCCL